MGRVALLFKYDQIRVSTSIMLEIGCPRHVICMLDRNNRVLYLRASRMHRDAFPVTVSTYRNSSTGFSICSWKLLRMIRSVMPAGCACDNVRCAHWFPDPVTIGIRLDEWTPTAREEED